MEKPHIRRVFGTDFYVGDSLYNTGYWEVGEWTCHHFHWACQTAIDLQLGCTFEEERAMFSKMCDFLDKTLKEFGV